MLHNLGTKTTVLSLLPNDVVTATGTGSAVDLAGYEGDMAVILDAEAGGAGITYACKLTEADATAGTAREVFDAATLGGARALQRDDLGRLAPDAKADIVLVDLEKTHLAPVAAIDPIKALVYCAHGNDVDTVIVDGVVRVANGNMPGVDLDRLWAGAEQFNARLRASVAQLTYRNQSVTEFYEPAIPTWQSEEKTA